MAFRILLFIVLSAGLASCTGPRFEELMQTADQLASASGFQKAFVNTGQFNLLTYQKITDPNKPITVYVEGDGRAWITRTRISRNPTPLNPTALTLATIDKQSKNILYIARPCQFIKGYNEYYCSAKYWTSHRYAREVVRALNKVVLKVEAKNNFSAIDLVGFSGGGPLVMLMTLQRDDFRSVRTVAGNIDTDAFIAHHKVSPMSGSLNPVNYADQLLAIPQIHFYGENDQSVPATISKSFMEKLNNTNCIKRHMLEGATHQRGWVEQWNRLLALPVECEKKF